MTDRREYYKQWKRDNKDHIKQYQDEYYNLNRDEAVAKQASDEQRLAPRSEQVVCNLRKANVTRHHMARHQKHQNVKTTEIHLQLFQQVWGQMHK